MNIANYPEHLLPQPGVEGQTSLSPSTLWDQIKRGLIPTPVRIGKRRIAWPESEIQAVIRWRIAGKSDDEIRALVKRLIAARTAEAPSAELPAGETAGARKTRGPTHESR